MSEASVSKREAATLLHLTLAGVDRLVETKRLKSWNENRRCRISLASLKQYQPRSRPRRVPPSEDCVDVQRAALLLHVSESYVRNLAKQGELEFDPSIARRRITRESLARYAARTNRSVYMQNEASAERLYFLGEVSQLTGLHKRTLTRYIERGRFPDRRIGQQPVLGQGAVNALLREVVARKVRIGRPPKVRSGEPVARREKERLLPLESAARAIRCGEAAFLVQQRRGVLDIQEKDGKFFLRREDAQKLIRMPEGTIGGDEIMNSTEAQKLSGFSEDTLMIYVNGNTISSFLRDGTRYFYPEEFEFAFG